LRGFEAGLRRAVAFSRDSPPCPTMELSVEDGALGSRVGIEARVPEAGPGAPGFVVGWWRVNVAMDRSTATRPAAVRLHVQGWRVEGLAAWCSTAWRMRRSMPVGGVVSRRAARVWSMSWSEVFLMRCLLD